MLRSALDSLRTWLSLPSVAPDALVLRPRSVADVQQIVRQCSTNLASVQVTGGSVVTSGQRRRHHETTSLSVEVDVTRMDRVLGMDLQKRCVLVECGMKLSKLLHLLEPIGLTLQWTGSKMVDMTLIDLVATGCSGEDCRFLFSIESVEVVTSDGSVNVWTWERHSSEMRALLGGLGTLAIVCSLTIKCVPLTRYSEVSYLCSVREVLSQWQLHCRSSWALQLWWFPFSELSVLTHTNVIDDLSPLLVSHPVGLVHKVVEMFTSSFSTASKKLVDSLTGLTPWQDTSWSSTLLSLLIALVSRVHFFTLWSLARQRSDRAHSMPPLWNAKDFQRGHKWLVPEHNLPEIIHCISKFVRYNKHMVNAKPIFIQRINTTSNVNNAIETVEESSAENEAKLMKFGAKKALMRSRRRKITERSEKRHRKRPYLMPSVVEQSDNSATAIIAFNSSQQYDDNDGDEILDAMRSKADNNVMGDNQGLCTVWYDWFLSEHEPDPVLVASFESIFHSLGGRRVWSTDRLTSPLVLRDALGDDCYAKYCRIKRLWDPENLFRSGYAQGTIYSEEMASQHFESTAGSVFSGSTLSLCSASLLDDE